MLYSFAKLMITGVIFYWLFRHVDMHHVLQHRHHLSYQTIGITWLCLLGSYGLAAGRWMWIVQTKKTLSKQGYILSFLHMTFAGVFLNQFLLGSVGGDVYKAVALKKRLGMDQTIAAKTVLADRLFGVMTMGGIGLFAGIFVMCQKGIVGIIWLWAVSLLIVGGAILLWVILKRLLHYCQQEKFPKITAALCFCDDLGQIIIDACPLHKTFSWILQNGILTFLLFVPVFFIARDVGVSLSLMETLLIMPFIFVVSCLPISFAGWGVREGAFIFALSFFGIEADQAILLSILYGGLMLVFALAFGCVLLIPWRHTAHRYSIT